MRWSQDSSVSIGNILRAAKLRNLVTISGWGQKCVSYPKRLDRFCGPFGPLCNQ